VDRKESASLRDAGTEQSEPGTGEKKAVLGLWTTHQEASQETGPGVLGKAGVQASAGPAGIWKPSSDGEGFRMRRLAGGERSTRFEPASQHSQLPLLRTRGHSSKSTFHASVCEAVL